MTSKEAEAEETKECGIAQLSDLINSDVYTENLKFWEKAWSAVKNAYTQMPDMPYVPRIPACLEAHNLKRVLDLGCGSGWLSIYLARAGFIVTGLDVASQALVLANQWAEQESLDVQFDVGDIAALEYPLGSFDAVVGNSIFEHLPYDLCKVTIARLKRIILPGGALIGCFDKVGGGPGEYYKMEDGTHVYTDKGRKGMMLRYFTDEELTEFFKGWKIECFETLESGSRFVVALTS